MSVTIRNIFLLLLLLTLILLILNFVPSDWSLAIADRFDLDKEANVPTWFSTVLLFSVSMASLIIYILSGSKKINTSWRLFWLGFSAVYSFLSLDETARIHEGMGNIFNVYWIIIYMPLGLIFFLTCAWFLVIINKNKNLAYWVLGGLIFYALGGIGCEAVNMFLYSGPIEVVFEEGLEMAGTIMVLTGCLHELVRRHKIIYNQSESI